MIKWFILNRAPTHSYALPCTLPPLPLTPIYSHPFLLIFNPLLLISGFFPPTPTHVQLTPTHFKPPPTVCRLSHPFPVHIQILTPNRIHHLPLQPKFSPFIYVRTCFTYLCVCALCFTFPYTYVIHFYAPYYVYILSMPLRVLISQDYLYTLRFF